MQFPAKTFIVTLVSAVTFAFGAAPATAAAPTEDFSPGSASVLPAPGISQTLNTTEDTLSTQALDSMMTPSSERASTPHNFDVEAAIALAESEIGTSRPTGWSQPGECIMSAQRWIRAGGGAWAGGGNPVSNYDGATRLTIADAQPGDIVQYEHLASPTSWVTGVHTLLITGVNDDGTFTIIESNNPGGSGLVSKDEAWTPKPPAGFQAVVWRF
ncbi:lipase [Leucobacter sp. CSA1]|uniref:Lipase n=1 Tax=Leucobacter chromiisoli TaxID=2796471 RepID=A0A934Q5S5_9MICO|nr:CHAP domain-containing protein [Leucobacter chromiisoli]MBK0417571.1 lipase [Leucobacter chromiisoli]